MIRNAYEQGIYSDTVMLREVDSENRLSISSIFAKAEPAFPNKEENETATDFTQEDTEQWGSRGIRHNLFMIITNIFGYCTILL